MKKLISISLIISIAAPFWISYSIINYQKYSVKKEIKRAIIKGIDKDDLVLLKFTKQEAVDNLEWEHSKEFEYSGTMYDIVESKTTRDSVYYWCWEDSEETELNIMLSTLVEKASAPGKNNYENVRQISNFLSTLFNSYENPFDLHRNQWSVLFATHYLVYYSFQPHSPQTPPPKIIT